MKLKPVFLILLFLTPIVMAERPEYPFSDEVFSELPPFPDDFYDIKELIALQKLDPSQLPDDYYQPEILPNWEYWCENVYNSTKTYSRYGLSVYPSRFDIYKAEEGQEITISALIYTNIGVSLYQGIALYLEYDKTIFNADIISEKNVVLEPTYPIISKDWMKLVQIRIQVLKEESGVINLREGTPEDYFNNQQINTYGKENYVFGGSILGQGVSRCSVYFNYEKQEEEIDPPIIGKNNNDIGVFIPYIIFLIVLFSVVLCIRKITKKKRIKDSH